MQLHPCKLMKLDQALSTSPVSAAEPLSGSTVAASTPDAGDSVRAEVAAASHQQKPVSRPGHQSLQQAAADASMYQDVRTAQVKSRSPVLDLASMSHRQLHSQYIHVPVGLEERAVLPRWHLVQMHQATIPKNWDLAIQ